MELNYLIEKIDNSASYHHIYNNTNILNVFNISIWHTTSKSGIDIYSYFQHSLIGYLKLPFGVCGRVNFVCGLRCGASDGFHFLVIIHVITNIYYRRIGYNNGSHRTFNRSGVWALNMWVQILFKTYLLYCTIQAVGIG